ncbi:hypothetical protein HOO69_05960 [Vibrio europaeus]|uniref:Uncharacterized protein n=1 Tax=Vibrio europaeus TaxID=300876 RepID=A0AAE7AWA7_9VIBR|nr:hypothetical protein [Vibrio europaeus]QJY36184.1 hypothetical protein HOO69_05960 [Vibrio europaeus]
METPAFLSILSDLVKPGSAIFGLVIIIQFLHRVLDSSRVYKIKQLELLHNCMADLSNIGSSYTVEKLLERTYKVHIPFEQAMAMMSHPKRQKLFALYKSSYKYLKFSGDQFCLQPGYSSKRLVMLEWLKYKFVNTIKYYVSAFIGGVLLVISFQFFNTLGLFEVQLITYNIIWLVACVLVSIFLLSIALSSLVDSTSIRDATKFLDHFEEKKVPRKVVWAY